MQKDAGVGAGLSDDAYVAAGAEIAGDADRVFADAELIVKVKEPLAAERKKLKRGQVLFTYLHLAADREQTEELLASGKLAAHPTFFECVTAIAFVYFAAARAEFAVCETGMGGRLDATNILLPEVAVITQIDFDHENYLGHSIEEIAGEKAGIIKPGARVVSAAEHLIARVAIRRRCAEQSAFLVEIENAYFLEDVTARDGAFSFTAISYDSGARIPIALRLAGRFQVRNALTALAAARWASANRNASRRGAPKAAKSASHAASVVASVTSPAS